MAKFDHERAHMAANLVSDPPVICMISSRKQSRSFVTLQINAGRHDYPRKSTGMKLSPKVKEIEPSGFEQNVRLETLKLAPQARSKIWDNLDFELNQKV